MAAPTIVDYLTKTHTGGLARQIAPPVTYSAGNAIYVFYASDGNGDTISSDGDFPAPFYDSIDMAGSGCFAAWRKIATGSEPAEYTFTNTVSERCVLVSMSVANDNGIHATGTTQSGSSATITVPAVITSIVDCLRISIGASPKPLDPLGTAADHTKLVDHTQASGGTLSIQYKALPSSGTDPSATISCLSDDWLGVAFAIAPTAGGGGGGDSNAALIAATRRQRQTYIRM